MARGGLLGQGHGATSGSLTLTSSILCQRLVRSMTWLSIRGCSLLQGRCKTQVRIRLLGTMRTCRVGNANRVRPHTGAHRRRPTPIGNARVGYNRLLCKTSGLSRGVQEVLQANSVVFERRSRRQRQLKYLLTGGPRCRVKIPRVISMGARCSPPPPPPASRCPSLTPLTAAQPFRLVRDGTLDMKNKPLFILFSK